MALTPVTSIPPGCNPQCVKSVVAKPQMFAYASVQGISLYRMERKSVPNLAAEPTAAAAAPPQTAEITLFSLQSLFGNGVNATVSAFDYNDEIMACLSAQTKNVVVWKLADSEPITSKRIPASLASTFKREGTPSAMCIAGKYHLIFGTATGRMISLNTNDGPHDAKCVAVPPPPMSAASTPPSPSSAQQQQSASGAGLSAGSGAVGGVECVAVSTTRADLVACGTSDGVLAFFTLSAATGLTPSGSLIPFPPPSKEKDRLLAPNALSVSVLAYDPVTPNQIAVGSSEGGLVLCDSNQPSAAVVTFDTKEKISGIAWVVGETGAFYTVSASHSLVQKWSVSSKAAVAAVAAVEAPLGIRAIACMDKDRVVLGLTNGAVKVYNMTAAMAASEASALEFETPAGHTDAVLSCRFSRHDKDVLASAGTDGTVRVWNMKTMSLVSTIEVGPVMVYGVDWSHNGKHLVAALGSGEVVQYNVTTHRQGWRTSVFPDLVFRVVWSSAGDSSVIVATSRSGVALLSKEGQVVRRIASPGGAVHGVDVEPTRAKTLAIACNDHKVYVYNLASSISEEPVLTLSGHADVVSDVAYNLAAPQFLLSGSYDGTLRVWDLSSNDSHTISVNARVLKGHADRVKSIAWCSVAPYLAVSGAADATMRLWDIRNGVCVTTVRGHNAEVGAITSHAERPLVFVSASRDGSFVVWFLSLLRQVYLDAALGTLEQCVVADAASLMAVASSSAGVSVSVVAGAAVQKLAKELRELSAAPKPTERMEKLVSFFECPLGSADLAQLASYAVDPSTFAVEPGRGGGGSVAPLVVPTAKLVESHRARAKQSVEKAHGKTVAAAGAALKKKRLMEAAEEMLRVGQLEEYCNLAMEAEEWDRAIAAAPGVSRAHWRDVCLKAAAAMEKAGDPRAATYYIVAEESSRAAALMTRLSLTNADAAAVVTRTCPQRLPGAAADAEPSHQTAVDTEGQTPAAKQTQERRMALLYRHQSPRVIAAAHLAGGRSDAAVRILARAGDVTLAHILVHTVPVREQASIDSVYHLSMLLSARLRQWDTAVMCASRQSNPYHSLATLIALFQFTHGKQVSRIPTQSVTSAGMASFHAINDKLKAFYEQVKNECARLQLPMDEASIKQRHASDGLASQSLVAAMVLQSDPAMGPVTSTQTLQSIHGFVESLLGAALQDADGPAASFYLHQAYNVSGYVALPITLPARSNGSSPGSPPASPLGGQANTSSSAGGGGTTGGALSVEHKRFLCLSYLVAALMCVKVYRFPMLLNPMFIKARELTQGDASLEGLVAKVQTVLGTYSPHSEEVSCAPVGAVMPAMASDGKQLVSSVTAQVIGGPVHLLEDSASLMSKEEALAWSMCCQFSPLASGARMSVL